MNLNGNLAATLNTASFTLSGTSGASNPVGWANTPSIDARHHTAVTFASGLQSAAKLLTSIAVCPFGPPCSYFYTYRYIMRDSINEQLHADVEEFCQFPGLSFADGSLAMKYFGSDPFGSEDLP